VSALSFLFHRGPRQPIYSKAGVSTGNLSVHFIMKVFPYHSLLWSMRAAISLGWIITGNDCIERTSQGQQEMLTAFERGRQ